MVLKKDLLLTSGSIGSPAAWRTELVGHKEMLAILRPNHRAPGIDLLTIIL